MHFVFCYCYWLPHKPLSPIIVLTQAVDSNSQLLNFPVVLFLSISFMTLSEETHVSFGTTLETVTGI